MPTVHRKIYFQTLHQNVYCAQKHKTFQTVNHKYVLCTETEHFPDGTSEMCTVHRNNNFQAVYQKCVLCTETEHYTDSISEMCTVDRNSALTDGTPEMCTVHRNSALSRRYIRNTYCAPKHYTLQTVHQKCVLCTETQNFRDCMSDIRTEVASWLVLLLVGSVTLVWGFLVDSLPPNLGVE